jgi:hypothetical protein
MQILQPHIIHANGGLEKRFPANGKYFTLEELQKIVGGNIEIVSLNDGNFMVLNEEGKLKNLPLNRKASDLFNTGGRLWYDPIVGDVLACGAGWLADDDDPDDEPDGDTYFDV